MQESKRHNIYPGLITKNKVKSLKCQSLSRDQEIQHSSSSGCDTNFSKMISLFNRREFDKCFTYIQHAITVTVQSVIAACDETGLKQVQPGLHNTKRLLSLEDSIQLLTNINVMSSDVAFDLDEMYRLQLSLQDNVGSNDRKGAKFHEQNQFSGDQVMFAMRVQLNAMRYAYSVTGKSQEPTSTNLYVFINK